jgi:hypothetical protein
MLGGWGEAATEGEAAGGADVPMQAIANISAVLITASQLRILKLLRVDAQVTKDCAKRTGRQIPASPVLNRRPAARCRVNPDLMVAPSLAVELTAQATKLSS